MPKTKWLKQIRNLFLFKKFKGRVFLGLVSSGDQQWHSVQFSCSVMSDSLRPHESQHARPPYPSPTPGVHSNSCPSSWWCHPAITSSVIPWHKIMQRMELDLVFQGKKNILHMALGDVGSIPGLGKSPGGGHGNSLQYSCQENLMDRGVWQASPQGHKKLDTTEAT